MNTIPPICDMKFEYEMVDGLSQISPIEEYCAKQGYKLACLIDEKIAVVVKPKPKWCPTWLYKKIIRECVEVVHKY